MILLFLGIVLLLLLFDIILLILLIIHLLTITPLLTLSLLHPLLTLSSALFIGCLKHGFLALKSIARDPSLPFHRPALERHIRATFLHGYGDTLPAAVDELRDIDMAGVCASVCVCMCVCKVLLEICITVFDFYSSIL